jgi:circadian clock protein KaiC
MGTDRKNINTLKAVGSLASTGISGLDDILGGGFPAERLYLIEGDPGAGKTTLALQFLLEGLKRGEPGLYVTLSETKEELRSVAVSHGWTLDQLNIYELAVAEEKFAPGGHYTFFHPSEVELGETTQSVLAEVERVKPVRVIFDSLSEMRLLARDPLRYRRQILGLKQFFVGRNCTVLLLDDRSAHDSSLQLQSLAHGVIMLEQLSPLYGAERRRLQVVKLRGVKFRGGYHDFAIRRGGLEVFPRLIAAEHPKEEEFDKEIRREQTSTGIGALDKLLGGGLTRGTSTLVMGPAGSGKSAFGVQHLCNAASQGEKGAIFMFDESKATLVERSEGLGQPLAQYMKNGLVIAQQIDPAELAPGEFVQIIRDVVEKDGVKFVVIDSLNGYLNAMPEEKFLVIQLHEVLTYLGQAGIVSILIVAQHGLLGSGINSPVDVSYLADSVLLLRYFELRGEVRKAISVVKKRYGKHETSIREYALSSKGIAVGEPLKQFHGILTGLPSLTEKGGTLDNALE